MHGMQRYLGRFCHPYTSVRYLGIINKMRGTSNVVYLTSLGEGAFGNPMPWVKEAIDRAVDLVQHAGLDIRLVKYS